MFLGEAKGAHNWFFGFFWGPSKGLCWDLVFLYSIENKAWNLTFIADRLATFTPFTS